MVCLSAWCVNLPAAAQNTIHVPANQPTIQAAIDASANGDIVAVSAGTYRENLDFKGKAMMVVSDAGPASTIIDGGNVAPVVTFQTNEGRTSVLRGFTV